MGTALWTRALLAAATAAFACAVCAPAAFSQATAGPLSLKEMRERGIVMQQWESSCAAAALATVLTYAFYDPVSESQAALGMLKHTDGAKVKAAGGFSMLDMKRFAADRGWEASGFQ
jgi:predicted double-glycine peptidase